MPVMSLCPLSVVIPSMESDLPIADDDNRVKDNVPVLLIESQVEVMDKTNDEKYSVSNPSASKEAVVTRKRKERRPSGEDSLQRSSSEERPSPGSLVSLEKIELLRRCSSHEEMIDALKTSNTELDVLYPKKVLERNIPLNIDSYLSGSLELVVSEKNHSPHPPNAKRREVEINKSDLELTVLPWHNASHANVSENSSSSASEKSPCPEKVINYGSMQNSFAELTDVNTMEFDVAGQENEVENEDSDRNTEVDEFQESRKARIPRSASCPVPGADSEGTSESENNSLSLSWSMLFESEDSEPVRSEHHSSWPMMKDAQDDDALLSPSVQSLRKSNFYEAPLSPSAYRSYLSYRSTHLDPSVPPSPPVEQEDFVKNLIESSAVSDSIKQLTKKIHSIKKRIRKFDEKFEAEFGYKPSHAEKANNSEAKKLMNDLYKARKELKALKEESHLEHVSSASSWHATRSSHILGDTTNHFQKATSKGAKPSVEDSFGVTMKSLADDRKTANRPENVEAMTTDQVKDEKLAIQKALLHFESIHGKPAAKDDRNTIRPLYDRYRNIKRLLVRSGSFPGAVSKNKDLCSELQPILEHETMDFTSPQNRSLTEEHVEKTESHENADVRKGEEKLSEIIIKDDFHKGTSSSQFLASKYDNSNVHELPL
ncbi:protein FAM13A-like [Stegodyphus dumicola]|uniref:protein FAM13A-like n=1 Tax=Stegodyphus dumicola TaxID=202533 RepID=UPI0015B2BC1C|nr:protein FAM13A-like [Stegodyphus dumicola]